MPYIWGGVVYSIKWLGKEVIAVFKWVPKIVTITEDVAKDFGTLMPQAVQVFTDVESLTLAAIKDGGVAVAAGQVLALAIIEAAEARIVNIPADAAVVAALAAFIKALDDKQTWTDVNTAISKLVKDYDAFGAASKAALKQLEDDVVPTD